MSKSKAQQIAEEAVRKAGGKKIPGKGRFSAVRAVKKEAKNEKAS